jgi:hypothetical protein
MHLTGGPKPLPPKKFPKFFKILHNTPKQPTNFSIKLNQNLLSQILAGLDDPIFGTFPLGLFGDRVIKVSPSLLSLILVKSL